jgi:hypothetical protein
VGMEGGRREEGRREKERRGEERIDFQAYFL